MTAAVLFLCISAQSVSCRIHARILQHFVATECHRQLDRCEHEVRDCSVACVRRVHVGQSLVRLTFITVLGLKAAVFQEMQWILRKVHGWPSRIFNQTKKVEIQRRDRK